MRRKEARLRKARQAQRYRRALERIREEPRLLFIERTAVRDPVVVEVASGPARHRLSGFWRETDFYRVNRVVETRREHDAIYYRVITDRGCFDLRRYRRMEPWTLRLSVRWELTAELDAIEVTRPF
jgi:hypothetical protein